MQGVRRDEPWAVELGYVCTAVPDRHSGFDSAVERAVGGVRRSGEGSDLNI